jgi:hypothetical protein
MLQEINPLMNVHGPSLGIGSGIAIVSIMGVFLVFNVMLQPETELKLTDMPQREKPISLSIFTDNGSPILGNPNAPITL